MGNLAQSQPSYLPLCVIALALPVVRIPRTGCARPDISLRSTQGLQLAVPLPAIAQMSRADMLPRHDGPRTLGTKPLCRMAPLIGPRCRSMELPVARALLTLGPERPQAAAMVTPPAELTGLCQRPLASPAEDWPAEATLPLPALPQVPLAENQRRFRQGAWADAAQPQSSVPGLIPSSRVAGQPPFVTASHVLPHCSSVRLETRR